MQQLLPEIDESVPLPRSATNIDLDLSPREEIEMRARTLKLLAELTNTTIETDEEDEIKARQLMAHVNANPDFVPDFDKFSNGSILILAELVKANSVQIVPELSSLKHYIVNKLIFEVEYSKSSKDRIAALKSLGEIDGVDAFKKRTETTHLIKPIEEVEKELITILDNIDYEVIEDGEPVEDIDGMLEQIPGTEEGDYAE